MSRAMTGAALAPTAAAIALALFAGQAQAQIHINFDSLTTGAEIQNYYNGGTDNLGETGPNFGVAFFGWLTTTNFGETSEPNLAYAADNPSIIDVSAGFSHQLAFTQGFFKPGNVSIYSGLDGAGSLLASYDLPASDPFAFAPIRLAFAGIAESVVFNDFDGGGNLGIDDLQIGGIPEPATWTMILLGVGGVGAALRSNRRRLGATAAT